MITEEIFHGKNSTLRVLAIKNKFLKYVTLKTGGCWIWHGYKSKDGYGICWRGYYDQRAHRTSYYLFNGEFDKNKKILHKCDNKLCVNPDHLYVGTVKDNVKDALERGQFPKGPNMRKSLPGKKNGRAKLTEENVKSIRSEYIPRIVSSRMLSKKYGVNERQILNIINGRTWKCVS